MYVLELLVDDSIYFEYEDFDEKFLTLMKTELKDAVKHAKKTFDRNSVPSSKNLNQRSIFRKK